MDNALANIILRKSVSSLNKDAQQPTYLPTVADSMNTSLTIYY